MVLIVSRKEEQKIVNQKEEQKIVNQKKEQKQIIAIVVLALFLITIFITIGYLGQQKSIELIDKKLIITELKYQIKTLQENKITQIDNRIKFLQPRLDSKVREKIVYAILKYSKRFNLSTSLVTHLIWRETIPKFNPLSKSSKGAVGLMQVMYEVHIKTIPELAKITKKELYHIENNIKFGCQILRGYIDSAESLDEALKKYVGGHVTGYILDIYRKMAEWEQEKYDLKNIMPKPQILLRTPGKKKEKR